MKKTNILIFTLCFIIVFCSGCGKKDNNKNNLLTDITENVSETVTTQEINIDEMDLDFSDNDLKSTYSDSEITVIEDDKNEIEITKDGVYKVSGKFSQLTVNTNETAKPHIILENAEISSANGPAINIISADKVFITLAEGSKNTLSDTAEYDSLYENADGVIFSKSDLTINGKGALNVKSNYKCGIVSKDDLTICDSKINVESIGTAVEGKDCVKFSNANIVINSQGDGIKSNNSEDNNRGYIYFKSGKVDITSVNDAIQAETALLIDNGAFNLKTGGGSAVSSSNYGKENNRWGMWGGGMREDKESTETDTESAKALKGGKLIKISKGEFTIDSSDDSIHSNSDLEINGGTFNISSGDDGIHADDQLIINNGTINISKSYEGIEATEITVNNGNINLTSSDDGFNAAGGNDSSAMGGRPGQNPFESDSEAQINFNGGYILVDASGDGIDSNGDLTLNGGILLVSGPENSGNGAMDYGGRATSNGGIAVIVGSSGMATTFDSSSKQPSFMYNTSSVYQGGTSLSVTKDDKVLASFTPKKQYNSIIVTSPDFSIGETYKLNIGGNVSSTDANGYTSNGKLTEPDEIFEIELTSVSTSNGGGGMGNMRPGGDMGEMRPDKGGMGGKRPW